MEEEKNEPSLTLPQLQQFFEERKGIINISPIAMEAGLSQGHLRRILNQERLLTEKSTERLLPVLQRHGYQSVIKEVTEVSLTLEQLQQFFKEREKTLNIGSLGREAGLSRSYLNRIVKEEKGLTQKTVIKLLPVLLKYGYQE